MLKIDKDWACPRKIESRQIVIIDFYRRIFKRKRIPSGQQYWTMCGKNTTDDGKILEMHEFDHVVKEGLVCPEQFHGVEINRKFHSGHTRTNRGTWHHGDFYEVMLQEDANDNFLPSIVNVDGTSFPNGIVPYVVDIMAMLAQFPHKIFLCFNVLLKQSYYHRYKTRFTGKDVRREMESAPSWATAWEDAKWEFPNWSESPNAGWAYYEYDGAGKQSSSVMGFFVCVKHASRKEK